MRTEEELQATATRKQLWLFAVAKRSFIPAVIVCAVRADQQPIDELTPQVLVSWESQRLPLPDILVVFGHMRPIRAICLTAGLQPSRITSDNVVLGIFPTLVQFGCVTSMTGLPFAFGTSRISLSLHHGNLLFHLKIGSTEETRRFRGMYLRRVNAKSIWL